MKALDLAKYIILDSAKIGYPVSNLQLQKVLYFTNMFYISKNDTNLIDEPFEAWQFGPVIREIYDEYSINGSNRIYLEEDDLFYNEIHSKLDDETKDIITTLCRANVWKLVDYSHYKGGAWDKTFDKDYPYKRAEISYDDIKKDALNFFPKNR